MEPRANFVKTGFFVVAILVGIFYFVHWLTASGRAIQYTTYEFVFAGPVPGLQHGSAVRFNGLKVGEVKQIVISKEDPSRLNVLVDIDSRTPIKANTKVRLDHPDLIGTAVVFLAGGTRGAPDLQAQPGQRYPRLAAETSEVQDLLDKARAISTDFAKVAEKSGALLTGARASLSASIWNLDAVGQSLPESSGAVEAGVGDATRAAIDMGRSLEAVSSRLVGLLAVVGAKEASDMTVDVSRRAAAISRISSYKLREYEKFATDARKAVEALSRASQSLERDPQRAVFGPALAIPQGPGR